jgi:hypothetical protein
MPSNMCAAASGGKTLNASDVAHVARMAAITTKKWGAGFTLRYRFLDGSAEMQK